MNYWSKQGILDRFFAHLQREQILRLRFEVVSMDSPIVKVHPNGTEALLQWTGLMRTMPPGPWDYYDA